MVEVKMTEAEIYTAEKDEFKELIKKIMPHLAMAAEQLGDPEKKRGVSVYITSDGYVSVDLHDSKWSAFKLNADAKPEIKCEYREVIE